ncbi:hypothetical protein Acr_22g0007230 [Actinidia rufa]|uniref:Uncharacterized protein n=1 Tax=Actinidia rufa TaxID=165716 RepID=A0A7J0GKM1_9ERIC|nr:hypothetical protein Acr_22g0007230 [Actinidia rufa]
MHLGLPGDKGAKLLADAQRTTNATSRQRPVRLFLEGGDSWDITIKHLQNQLAEMAQLLVDNKLTKPAQVTKEGPSEGSSKRLKDPPREVRKGSDVNPNVDLESQTDSKFVASSKRRVSSSRAHFGVDLRETINAKQNREGDLRAKLHNCTVAALVKTIILARSIAYTTRSIPREPIPSKLDRVTAPKLGREATVGGDPKAHQGDRSLAQPPTLALPRNLRQPPIRHRICLSSISSFILGTSNRLTMNSVGVKLRLLGIGLPLPKEEERESSSNSLGCICEVSEGRDLWVFLRWVLAVVLVGGFFICRADGESTTVREYHSVIIGTAKYGRRGHGFWSKRRRIPNGDNTANVGELVEMESQSHLILRVTGEMEKIRIGDVRTHGEYSRKSELNEVIASNKAT